MTLAGLGAEDQPVESTLGTVRVVRWPTPDKLAPPLRTGRRLFEAVARYPDRTTGRATARRLAAARREAQVRRAVREVTDRRSGSALAADARRRGRLALARAEAGVLAGRTLLHRVRWLVTQRGNRPETSAQRELRHSGERAAALGLELGPRIEALASDAVWAVGADALATAAGAVARMRAAGRTVRLVYDARSDVGHVPGVSRQVRRLARLRLGRERTGVRLADRVVVPTPELQQLIGRRYPGAPVARVPDDLPPAVGAEPQGLRERLGLDTDAPLLVATDAHLAGAVGQLRGLTAALADLPDVHLALLAHAGTPGLRAVRDLAWSRSLGDRWYLVEVSGPAYRPELLRGATAAVVTVADPLAGVVTVPPGYRAAVTAGVPVLAHAAGLLPGRVERDGTGGVADLTDPRDARRAVRELLDAVDLLRRRWRPAPAAAGTASIAEVLAIWTESGAVAAPPPAALVESRLTPLRETRVLGVGPANFAGQGWAWAKAAEAVVPGLRTEVFAVDQGVLTFPADRRIRRRDLRALSWQLEQQRRVLTEYTHLLAEANRPVFGFLNGEDLSGDLPALRRSGLALGLALHGSEVRDPAAHREREPWSPFRVEDELFEQVSAFVERTRAVLKSFDGPVFVSTPDLLDDVPHGIWLPVVVDVTSPAGSAPLERDRPVVVHAPSRSRLKGSADIDATLRRLHDEGLCEYRRLERVPPTEMPAALAAADVVLDQFAIGSYGVLACEAMAAGRVVVGHVRQDVRERVGEPLPVVEATPDDVEDVLRALVDDRDAARATAAAGRAFVERVHGGRRSGQVLAEHLLSLPHRG